MNPRKSALPPIRELSWVWREMDRSSTHTVRVAGLKRFFQPLPSPTLNWQRCYEVQLPSFFGVQLVSTCPSRTIFCPRTERRPMIGLLHVGKVVSHLYFFLTFVCEAYEPRNHPPRAVPHMLRTTICLFFLPACFTFKNKGRDGQPPSVGFYACCPHTSSQSHTPPIHIFLTHFAPV